MDYKQKAKQLQKDKRALLRQLRSLQRNIREYDQTILNRIIENKNIKVLKIENSIRETVKYINNIIENNYEFLLYFF